MSKDQWTVTGGLVILLLLETVLHPTIKGWITGFANMVYTANAAKPSSTQQTFNIGGQQLTAAQWQQLAGTNGV